MSESIGLWTIPHNHWPSQEFSGRSIQSYGLQDALSPRSDSGKSYIFNSTCTPREGSLHCFDACNATTGTFANVEFLHNCFMSTYIREITKAPEVIVTPFDTPDHQNERQKILVPDGTLGDQVISSLGLCVSGPYDSLVATTKYIPHLSPGGSTFQQDYLTSFVSNDYCPYVSAQVDSDIGGIGVCVPAQD